MSLRTTPTVKVALVAAASQSGRSLTQEIEFRLEASFAEDRMRQVIREELSAAREDTKRTQQACETALKAAILKYMPNQVGSEYGA